MTNTYVPAQTEIAATQPPPLTVQTVWAMWLGNFGAGVGVGLVVAIVVNRAFNFTWQDTALWFACAAGLAFGVLMAVRFSLDEIIEAWEWQRTMAYIGDLEAENELLQARIDALEQDVNLERLQRFAQAKAPAPTRVDVQPETKAPVLIDAEDLLTRHFAGRPWARDAMKKYAGWTPTRWNMARDLLEARGVCVTVGKGTRVQPASLVEAFAWLNNAPEA